MRLSGVSPFGAIASSVIPPAESGVGAWRRTQRVTSLSRGIGTSPWHRQRGGAFFLLDTPDMPRRQRRRRPGAPLTRTSRRRLGDRRLSRGAAWRRTPSDCAEVVHPEHFRFVDAIPAVATIRPAHPRTLAPRSSIAAPPGGDPEVGDHVALAVMVNADDLCDPRRGRRCPERCADPGRVPVTATVRARLTASTPAPPTMGSAPSPRVGVSRQHDDLKGSPSVDEHPRAIGAAEAAVRRRPLARDRPEVDLAVAVHNPDAMVEAASQVEDAIQVDRSPSVAVGRSGSR